MGLQRTNQIMYMLLYTKVLSLFCLPEDLQLRSWTKTDNTIVHGRHEIRQLESGICPKCDITLT